MSVVIARVLPKRDHPGVALVVSSLAAFSLALIAIDDLARVRAIPIPAGTAAYSVVAVLFAILAILPWLTPARRARPARVLCSEGHLRIDERIIEGRHVTAFSIARAARGLSIAIERGNDVTFVEVDRDEDAVRIARALGRDPAERSTVSPQTGNFGLALAQAFGTFGLLVSTPLYWLGAMNVIDVGKEVSGITGLVFAFVAIAVFGLRRLVTSRSGTLIGSGAWGAHTALHRTSEAAVLAPQTTMSPLARGDEPVGAWLDRLDKLPANEGAYRALPPDVLHGVLSDDEAAPDARMGAARVLRRRYGEPASIVRVVADPELRIRVEAAADGDVEEAEEKIERLGPVFRAR